MTNKALIIPLLQKVDIFQGLDESELTQIAELCRLGRAKKGHIIFREDAEGDELYVVYDGAVEIQVPTRGAGGKLHPSTIMTVYPGQSFGEMAILGGGTRSATAIVSATPTTLVVLPGDAFMDLCEQNTRIGYRVMRNLIDDLTYKLRSSSLLLRGNIKWQDGQLSQL